MRNGMLKFHLFNWAGSVCALYYECHWLLVLWVLGDFMWSCWLFSMASSRSKILSQRRYDIIECHRILDENMLKFSVNTVSADGLAPWGARPSAGTVMTKFGSCIYMGPTIEGLEWQSILHKSHGKTTSNICLIISGCGVLCKSICTLVTWCPEPMGP